MHGLRIVPAGDAALLVELPARIDPATSEWVIALARAVRERCAGALRDVVVGYCSVTIYFDPLSADAASLESEIRTAAAGTPADLPVREGPLLEVPVCYGGDDGPDLGDVASFANASEQEVVALHSARIYRVYMIGFVPGFAYMASVDPRIAAPRRSTPRTRVPAGSVAVAAGQTGIYPAETPGGWHLIGRTHLKPYDPARIVPALFRPGDRVRFCSVDRKELAHEA
jgi:KipI family sensor histidine kinase inhibitor